MKLNLNNDIEIVALIHALEDKITKTIEEYGVDSMTYKSVLKVYNQVKTEYIDRFNFKY